MRKDSVLGLFRARSDKDFYHINYAVIQGFPALRKTVTTYVRNIVFLHLCLTSPNTMSGWWMKDKAVTILNPRSFVRIFSYSGSCNTEKSVSLTGSDVQTFLEGKENQNTERKTESYVFSGFGDGISRGWERKSTTGRFATGRVWSLTWKISFSGKYRPNTWEFWVFNITLIVFF